MATPLELKFNQLTGDDFNLVPKDMSAISKEKTGFKDPDLVTVIYDPTAQTVTLGGTVEAYYQNALNSTLVSGYVSAGHDNVLGHYYWLYADGPDLSNVKWMTDAFPGMDKILIAVVIYYTNYKFCIRECHGLAMDWSTHFETHFTIGTWRAGGSITAGTYTINSTTDTTKRPQVDELTIWDEDLKTVLPALITNTYNKVFLTGTTATPVVNFTGATAEIVPMNTGIVRPAYNQLNGANWQQTAMSSNAYQAIFVLAMPVSSSATSQAYRYLFIQGQLESVTLSTIQALTPNNIVLAELATLAPEYILFAKIIIRYVGSGTNNWNLVSVETLTGNKQGQSFSTITGLTSVATDGTIQGNGTSASPISTTPIVDANGVYNGRILPNTAYKAVADGLSTTLTFDSDGAMTFSVIYDGSVGMLCNTCFGCPSVSVFSDPMNVYLPTDAGTGIYIGKGSGSYNVTVKNRTGSSQNIIIQSINSNITSATTWA